MGDIMKTYIVYKYTNVCNGKIYIGQTCQSLSDRAGKEGSGYQGCTHFYRAIQKYGWQNFEVEILANDLTKDQADIQEKYYIDLYCAKDPNFGYNLLEGGQGERQCYSKTPEQTSLKHSETMAQIWSNPDRRENFSVYMKNFYQNKDNQDKIKTMQEKKKGKNHPRSKPVICLETGQTFSCLREAAAWCGLSLNSAVNIGSQAAGKRPSAGVHPITKVPLHWCFVDKENCNKVSMKGRRVKNIDTEECFDSLTQASQSVGISTATIKKSCDSQGKIGVRGHGSKYNIPTHWVFI